MSENPLTFLVTIDPEFRKELEFYRSILERGHASRGTPREVSFNEALLEAAKLGVSTAKGMAWFMSLAQKKAKEGK